MKLPHRAVVLLLIAACATICHAADLAPFASAAKKPQATKPDPARWNIGTPIVTYWGGPALSEAVIQQMINAGFNVVWCTEGDLDLLSKHGLRGMLRDKLLRPATLNKPEQVEKLNALIERVRGHKALYAYFLTDEPGTEKFPALGQLIGHLRQRDPAHLAYLNLFPTYATNEQLGTKGDTVIAYQDYLTQFVDTVKPSLLSYDHYQFNTDGDSDGYFLNLAMVRSASMQAKIPFLNVVQASSWQPAVRVPSADETRYLVYTTLAYGAQGISYYVYQRKKHEGGIVDAEGKPTPLYEALRTLNPEFLHIATELQPLKSLAVYHTALKQPGCQPLPANAPFHPESPPAAQEQRGLALGYFGPADQPTHVLVVNLNYRAETTVTLLGPGELELFDATTSQWKPAEGAKLTLRLPPGGGKLVRLR